MNSSTSNSDRSEAILVTFLRWGFGRTGICVATFVALIAMGEVYMRGTFLPGTFYRPDDELGHVYYPNHRSIHWQANYSIPSPPISFNADGDRGTDTHWDSKIILALGSSEVLAPGILDDETWCAQLELLLREAEGDASLEVVNGGVEAHGPYHNAITLERAIEKHDIATAVMRVNVGDRNFKPPTGPATKSDLHLFLREKTMFVRFIINKAQAQVRPIKKGMVPFPFRKERKVTDPTFVKAAEKMWTANEQYWRRAMEAAEKNDVRLVFLVINAVGYEGNTYLADRLTELTDETDNVSVVEIGPDVFDLQDVPMKDRPQVFEETLTLDHDPHGNAKQHRMIAEAVRDYLLSK